MNRWIVVSSVKITLDQFHREFWWEKARRHYRWCSVSNGFNNGDPQTKPASCNRRRMVLAETFTPRSFNAFDNREELASGDDVEAFRIFLSSDSLVFRFRPLPGLSKTSPVFRNVSNQCWIVDLEHPISFAASPTESFGPKRWVHKKTISQRRCTESDIIFEKRFTRQIEKQTTKRSLRRS